MQTASDFAAALGRKNMAARLGVGLTAIGNAVVSGEFPSSWFLELSKLAEELGASCPVHLFAFRRSTESGYGDAQMAPQREQLANVSDLPAPTSHPITEG